VLSPPKVSPLLRQLHPGAETIFRDAYVVEFLDLPEGHREADLHKSLLRAGVTAGPLSIQPLAKYTAPRFRARLPLSLVACP
jgi:hypothetical protein